MKETAMTIAVNEGYNERLFSGNWRSRLHLSRFYWVLKQMRKLDLKQMRLIELGCYDAKIIGFLDFAPEKYLGLDANWEGGLDSGKDKWKDLANVELRLCRTPEDIPAPQKPFNIGICMETLEHIPPDLVEPYLQRLGQVIEGYLFITIPVERGIIFFLKHGLKKIFGMKDSAFLKGEFVNSVIGRLDKVKRHEHKGFDDRVFVRQVAKFFDIISVCGVFPKLPLISLNLTIGIIAKTKGFERPA